MAAEEGGIAEVIIPCYLLDVGGGGAEVELDAHDDVMVDERFWSMSADVVSHVVEVFGGDVEHLGVMGDGVAGLVVVFELFHEKGEEALGTAGVVGERQGLSADKEVVIAEKEGFELIEGKLILAAAVVLSEIDAEEGEHAVDDGGDGGFVGAATVAPQVGIDGVFELEACLAQKGAVESEHFYAKVVGSVDACHIAGKEHEDGVFVQKELVEVYLDGGCSFSANHQSGAGK